MMYESNKRRLARLEARMQGALAHRLHEIELSPVPPTNPAARARWDELRAEQRVEIRADLLRHGLSTAVVLRRTGRASDPSGPVEIGGYLLAHAKQERSIWQAHLQSYAEPDPNHRWPDDFLRESVTAQVVLAIFADEEDILRDHIQHAVDEIVPDNEATHPAKTGQQRTEPDTVTED